jgi:hypothetical protein
MNGEENRELVVADGADHVDAQLAELIELVWTLEATWALDDQIDMAIKYGRCSK